MPLPTCDCNAGLPTQDQLANIYCALFTLVEAGGGGGFTPPLLPSLGGTGVANADTETITLNGGFPLTLTLAGSTTLTLIGNASVYPSRQFTLVMRNVALNTVGSPTDLASVGVPAGVTTWRIVRISVASVTAAGTLAATVLQFFSQAAGAGVALSTAATYNGLTGAGRVQTLQSASTSVDVSTDLNAFVRQTTDSANAGTVDIFLDCLDMT